MKTTVVGVRLNDYQREHLKNLAGEKTEGELIKIMVDSLINGEFSINRDRVVLPEECDIRGLKRIAERKRISVQKLIDAIVEQLE